MSTTTQPPVVDPEPGGNDRFWSDVRLLAKGGTIGSNEIIDLAGRHGFTPSNITIVPGKFGPAIYSSLVNSPVVNVTGNPSDFYFPHGTEWTIDGWLRINSYQTPGCLFYFGSSYFYINSLRMNLYSDAYSVESAVFQSELDSTKPHFFSICKKGTDVWFHIGGKLVRKVTDNTKNYGGLSASMFNDNYSEDLRDSYLEDFRVTGHCRYGDADYDVPTASQPNS